MLRKILKLIHAYALKLQLWSCMPLLLLAAEPCSHCFLLLPLGSLVFSCEQMEQLGSYIQLCLHVNQDTRFCFLGIMGAWSYGRSQGMPRAEPQKHNMNGRLHFPKNVTEERRIPFFFSHSTAHLLEDSHRREKITFTSFSNLNLHFLKREQAAQ